MHLRFFSTASCVIMRMNQKKEGTQTDYLKSVIHPAMPEYKQFCIHRKLRSLLVAFSIAHDLYPLLLDSHLQRAPDRSAHSCWLFLSWHYLWRRSRCQSTLMRASLGLWPGALGWHGAVPVIALPCDDPKGQPDIVMLSGKGIIIIQTEHHIKFIHVIYHDRSLITISQSHHNIW